MISHKALSPVKSSCKASVVASGITEFALIDHFFSCRITNLDHDCMNLQAKKSPAKEARLFRSQKNGRFTFSVAE